MKCSQVNSLCAYCLLQLSNSILELLVDNLSRFNETEESDRQGIFHVLGKVYFLKRLQQLLNPCTGIFENILGFNAELSTQLVSKTKILPWVLKRIESPKHDENRGYAAEILSILLQNNRTNRLELGKKDGVECILKILSVSLAPHVLIRTFTRVLEALPQERSRGCRRDRVHGKYL